MDPKNWEAQGYFYNHLTLCPQKTKAMKYFMDADLLKLVKKDKKNTKVSSSQKLEDCLHSMYFSNVDVK